MEKKGSQSSILSFQNFAFKKAAKTESFSLDLKAGELAVFHLTGTQHLLALSDALVGMTEPDRGKILFQGEDWLEMDPHHVDLHRLTIGQVFDATHRPAWVENLDVDENIILAQCFSAEKSREQLLERAHSLAAEVGLMPFPHNRPSSTRREHLTLAQWVRALLPDPLRLLILDNPLYGLSPEHDPILTKLLERVRQEGTSILWLAHEPPGKRLKDLQVSHRFDSLPAAFALS